MSTVHASFQAAIDKASVAMRDYSRIVRTESWQGVDIKGRPEAAMREVIGWDFRVAMPHLELPYYQEQIRPNLPWADEHFNERVCGYPMNPGESWKRWPFAHSAANFLDKNGRFEVNYMERFWAGGEFEDTPTPGAKCVQLTGIRGRPYGDLESIINLLDREPLTRQAYLPIYFPEDTGAGGRVPCSLGYHWLMRGGFFHVHYPIRSCDFFRHFRDDIYLAVRLTIWLMQQLAERNKLWRDVKPGYYSMWIGSLHIFINDYIKLYGSSVR